MYNLIMGRWPNGKAPRRHRGMKWFDSTMTYQARGDAMKFKSTGILRYNPYRGTMKGNTDWWLVVNTDAELVSYYAQQVINNPTAFGETHIDLIAPSWGSHISVIRGEEPRNSLKHLWKKYDGEKIEFEYSHIIRRGGGSGFHIDHFWFVDVWCDKLNKFRRELGLKAYDTVKQEPFHYHLTIGRLR